MTRIGLLALTGTAVALAATVGLELQPWSGDEGAMSPNQPHVPPAAAAPAAGQVTTATVPAAEPARRYVQTILERPLFAPNRRPAPPAAGLPDAPAIGVPRVAGILVDGGRRSVIFAAAEGGKPQVLTEGAMVGGFRIDQIDSAQVRVVGPNGTRVLRPSFDPSRPAPAPVSGLAGLPGLPGLPGLSVPPGPAAR